MNRTIWFIVCVIGLMLYGTFDAVKDTVDHHYSVSIFSDTTKYGEYFKHDWTRKYERDGNGEFIVESQDTIKQGSEIVIVTKYKKKTFRFLWMTFKQHPAMFDVWHLMKVFMYGIICLLLAYDKELKWYWILIRFIVLGTAGVLAFNFGYDGYLLIK